MNEKLKEYVGKSKEDEQKRRDRLLISEGLYYDVRLADGEQATQDSVYGKDPTDNRYHYFKRHAEELTEEEYEEFLKAYKNNLKSRQETSVSGGIPGIAICFYIVGFIVLLAGLIIGIQFGNSGIREFGWIPAVICWSVTLIGSLFMFGFGKVISLLNEIKNK